MFQPNVTSYLHEHVGVNVSQTAMCPTILRRMPDRLKFVLAPPGSEKIVDEQSMRSVGALDWTTTTQRNYNLHRVREKVNVKEAYLYSAYYDLPISRRSRMARVRNGSHSFTCHPHVYPQMKWTIPAFNPTSPQFGWYSFPVPLRIGGWVGLGGLVKYWGGLPARRRSPLPGICRGGRELNRRPSSRWSNAHEH